MRPIRTLIPLAAALSLGACSDPYESRSDLTPRTTTTTTATAPSSAPVAAEPTVPVPPPEAEPGEPPRHAGGDARATPARVLAEFGRRWSNWDWRSAPAQKGRLLPLSTGALERYIGDQNEQDLDRATLARTRIGYRGRVEGIVLRQRSGDRRGALVIIRQQEYEGRRPRPGTLDHTVYLAEVTWVGDGWSVSRWEGQE